MHKLLILVLLHVCFINAGRVRELIEENPFHTEAYEDFHVPLGTYQAAHDMLVHEGFAKPANQSLRAHAPLRVPKDYAWGHRNESQGLEKRSLRSKCFPNGINIGPGVRGVAWGLVIWYTQLGGENVVETLLGCTALNEDRSQGPQRQACVAQGINFFASTVLSGTVGYKAVYATGTVGVNGERTYNPALSAFRVLAGVSKRIPVDSHPTLEGRDNNCAQPCYSAFYRQSKDTFAFRDGKHFEFTLESPCGHEEFHANDIVDFAGAMAAFYAQSPNFAPYSIGGNMYNLDTGDTVGIIRMDWEGGEAARNCPECVDEEVKCQAGYPKGPKLPVHCDPAH